MIDYRAVRQGLRAILLAVPGLPTARAWENRAFTPPNPPERWVRETLLFSSERLMATNTLEASGVMQYSLFEPAGVGTESVEDFGRTVRAAFKPTTTVPAVGLIVDRAECITGMQEPQWYHVPIRITWRAYAANT